jgi:hypothetical protein
LLRKASLWSYVIGIWELLSVIVVLAAVFIMVMPLLTMMGPIPTPGIIALIYQALNSLMIALVVVLGITVPITFAFGYYCYKVGDLYDVGSLKLAGACNMITALGYPMLIYGLYQFLTMLFSMLPSPPPNFAEVIFGSLGFLLLGAGVVGLFGFVFFIAFIVAASGMKTRTGISDFGTAMWLSIVGLFIPFFFPIAVMIFGSGLSKLSKVGATRPARGAAPMEAAKVPTRRETVYCPYCGARVEPDALFCPSCGSSLKKEE